MAATITANTPYTSTFHAQSRADILHIPSLEIEACCCHFNPECLIILSSSHCGHNSDSPYHARPFKFQAAPVYTADCRAVSVAPFKSSSTSAPTRSRSRPTHITILQILNRSLIRPTPLIFSEQPCSRQPRTGRFHVCTTSLLPSAYSTLSFFTRLALTRHASKHHYQRQSVCGLRSSGSAWPPPLPTNQILFYLFFQPTRSQLTAPALPRQTRATVAISILLALSRTHTIV